jgi:hypothetical protein
VHSRTEGTARTTRRWTRAAVTGVLGLAAATALTTPAQAAIEVDHGIEFVNITNVPKDTPLLLTVTDAAGNTLGSKAFTTATGAYEVNHLGGADCFDAPSSPDIRPGDTLTVSDSAAPLQSYTVADVRYSARFDPAVAADPVAGTIASPPTMVAGGWARNAAGVAIPAAELRLLRGPFSADVEATGGSVALNRGNRINVTPAQSGDGTFTMTILPIEESSVSEAVLTVVEGSNGTSFSGDAAVALPGCPPLDTTRAAVAAPPLPPAPIPPGDADGDGVTNDVDKCPTVAGAINNDGCPVTTPAPVVVPGPAPPAQVVERTVVQNLPLAGAAVAAAPAAGAAPDLAVQGTQAQSLAVTNLSLAQRISITRLRAQGLRLSMRVPNGARVVRIAVHRARNGQKTGRALFAGYRNVTAGQFRATIRDRSLLGRLGAGQYVVEVRAGASRSALAFASRRGFRVNR